MTTRKTTTMTLTISYPSEDAFGHHMTPADARREVRTLLTEQANYRDLDISDIKVRKLRGVRADA